MEKEEIPNKVNLTEIYNQFDIELTQLIDKYTNRLNPFDVIRGLLLEAKVEACFQFEFFDEMSVFLRKSLTNDLKEIFMDVHSRKPPKSTLPKEVPDELEFLSNLTPEEKKSHNKFEEELVNFMADHHALLPISQRCFHLIECAKALFSSTFKEGEFEECKKELIKMIEWNFHNNFHFFKKIKKENEDEQQRK